MRLKQQKKDKKFGFEFYMIYQVLQEQYLLGVYSSRIESSSWLLVIDSFILDEFEFEFELISSSIMELKLKLV